MDKEYPIHIHDICILIGISMDGEYVSTKLHGSCKRDKKIGNANLYEKYDTRSKVHGVVIYLINDKMVIFFCCIIIGKVTQHYTKAKCTLDTISIVKFWVQGKSLNWCKFMLDEVFVA